MVELFHMPVGACRDDAHAPCHQQAEEPEDGDDDDHAHRFLLAQDRRFSYAVLSTRTPSDTIMGVHEWECERPMGKDAGSFRPLNTWNTPKTG